MSEQRRIELGIDGDHAFALLGDDIQSGECEFVKIETKDDRLQSTSEIIAAGMACQRLRRKLGKMRYPYFFAKSHPYGHG